MYKILPRTTRTRSEKMKYLFKTTATWRLFFFIAALFLAMAGCGPDPFYVRVASIEGVPETGKAGTPLTLTANVRPAFASNKDIVWSVKDAGTTGADISGNVLNTETEGTVTISAKIANGIAEGKEYTQDFKIVFNKGNAVITPINSAAINITPPAKNVEQNTGADAGGESVNYTIGEVSWSPDHNPFMGETVYTAAVTLTANEGYKFPNIFTATVNGNHATASENTGTTVKISYTFERTLGKAIVTMSIKSPPAKMTYTGGEALDLSGLTVTLIFDNGSTEDVAYGNFNAYNITTVPAHDTPLTVAHNGQPITVTGGGKRANTGNLTVNKASAPAVIFPNALPITYGEALSTSTLSGGTTGRGAFAWDDPAAIPTVINDGYYMVFTPNDTDNYDYTGISDFDHYTKTIMRKVLITVNKAAGSDVTKPSGAWNSSAKTITVTAVSLNTATGQGIEYAISTSSSAEAALLTWTVNKLTFDITVTDTTYFIYARSALSTNYSAGAANVSEGIAASSVNIDMVPIPAGTFTMGSPTSEPNRESNETQHSVTLSSFKMSKYQVTQEQYQTVMGSNPSNFTSAVEGESGTPGKLPVETVSWYDALVFCNKLSIAEGLNPVYSISGKTNPSEWGSIPTSSNSTWNAAVMDKSKNGYRLPTEAEWEYACRAGTTTAYNTGDTISDNTGWYRDNSGSKTHEVGKKSANAWGLYDMQGNVVEWCWDWYDSSYYSSSPANDPTGPVTGSYRVIRSGGWNSYGRFLRSACRNDASPSSRGDYFGFRLACSSE